MARGSFGERLKRERELREVTLEEITSATRIGPRFLEALENEEWEKLPGGVFNRGFVRSVARYLGLDEEVLLGEYDLAHGAQLQSVAQRQESIPAVPRWFPVVILLGILVVLAGLIAGGIYAWRRYSANRATKQSFVVPQQAASAKESSEVAAAYARAVLLELNLPKTSAWGHALPSVQ
jgi:cytoskeletal protein RodZ